MLSGIQSGERLPFSHGVNLLNLSRIYSTLGGGTPFSDPFHDRIGLYYPLQLLPPPTSSIKAARQKPMNQ